MGHMVPVAMILNQTVTRINSCHDHVIQIYALVQLRRHRDSVGRPRRYITQKHDRMIT